MMQQCTRQYGVAINKSGTQDPDISNLTTFCWGDWRAAAAEYSAYRANPQAPRGRLYPLKRLDPHQNNAFKGPNTVFSTHRMGGYE